MSETVRIPRWAATLAITAVIGVATTAMWRAWDAFVEMRDAFNRQSAEYVLFKQYMEQYIRDHP